MVPVRRELFFMLCKGERLSGDMRLLRPSAEGLTMTVRESEETN